MLLGTLGASLLRNILTRIERLRAGCGNKEYVLDYSWLYKELVIDLKDLR